MVSQGETNWNQVQGELIAWYSFAQELELEATTAVV